jgi:peptidylprolyl isomerase
MSQAKDGDSVKIHYTGTLDSGETFDSSKGRAPLEFTLGSGQVIPGFDKAVSGMAVGETKTETIPAADAYGERRDEMILKVPKSQVPPDVTVEVGSRLAMKTQDGQEVPVEVTEITEESITLDANHPLAGKALTFEIELVEVG